MKYNKKVLSNGLTIIEVPSSDAESVVVDFFVKTGSRSETAKENGISHFLEHFLFKGSRKYPSAMAISEVVDAIGGEMNANTGKEYTQFYIKAASKHLPLIFGILTDMIQNPLLDKEEMKREKGVIMEEINMYKDMPMVEIDNVLERTMWPKDALGRDIAGTKKIVAKFSRQMFADYINRHYQTPNILLGVSGKYNAKQLSQLIQKYWQSRKRTVLFKKDSPHWIRVKDKQSTPRIKIDYKDTKQAHLALGFKGFAYGDSRNSAVSVLAAVLGGGMSSRLFTEVREKRGLGYYVRSSQGNYQDTGSFTVSAGVQVDKITEALKVILVELKKIKGTPVGEKEIQKAKEYIKGKTVLALEDNQVRLDWFLERTAFYKKIEIPEEVFKRIDAVSAKDIAKVAKQLFVNKGMTLAIIGPYKTDRNFRRNLNVESKK